MARSTLRFPMVFGFIRVHRLLGRGRSGGEPATHWDTASGAWGTSLRGDGQPILHYRGARPQVRNGLHRPGEPASPWAVKGRMVFPLKS